MVKKFLLGLYLIGKKKIFRALYPQIEKILRVQLESYSRVPLNS